MIWRCRGSKASAKIVSALTLSSAHSRGGAHAIFALFALCALRIPWRPLLATCIMLRTSFKLCAATDGSDKYN